MQLLAKFKKILYVGFSAVLNFRKFKVCHNYVKNNANVFTSDWTVFWYHDCSINNLIKSGYNDKSKSKSWNVLETVLLYSQWKVRSNYSVIPGILFILFLLTLKGESKAGK